MKLNTGAKEIQGANPGGPDSSHKAVKLIFQPNAIYLSPPPPHTHTKKMNSVYTFMVYRVHNEKV